MSETNVIENEETAVETIEEPADRPEPPKDENGNPCPPPHGHGPHGPHGPRPDGERPEPPKDENGSPCPPPHHKPHGPRPDGPRPEDAPEEAPAAESAVETA